VLSYPRMNSNSPYPRIITFCHILSHCPSD
jgi:hypothetical protein